GGRQFGGATLRLVDTIPVPHRHQVGTALTHQEVEPPNSHGDDMPRELANGEDLRSCAECELFRRQRGNRRDETLLRVLQTFEESDEWKLAQRHGCSSPRSILAIWRAAKARYERAHSVLNRQGCSRGPGPWDAPTGQWRACGGTRQR